MIRILEYESFVVNVESKRPDSFQTNLQSLFIFIFDSFVRSLHHRRWSVKLKVKLNCFYNPHPNGFCWGCQCSWTLTPANSMQVSNMQSNDCNRKEPDLRQGLNPLCPKILGWIGSNQLPTYLGQLLLLCSTWLSFPESFIVYPIHYLRFWSPWELFYVIVFS